MYDASCTLASVQDMQPALLPSADTHFSGLHPMSLGQEGEGQNSTAENDCFGDAVNCLTYLIVGCDCASFIELVQPVALKIVTFYWIVLV